MKEVADRDSLPENEKRWNDRLAAVILAIFAGILGVAVLAVIVQLFGRYEYVVSNGIVWRVDRITHQACRIIQGHPPLCGVPSSTSTSTSLSTSPSTSARKGARASPK